MKQDREKDNLPQEIERIIAFLEAGPVSTHDPIDHSPTRLWLPEEMLLTNMIFPLVQDSILSRKTTG